jgi:hypothetical protein
MDENKTQQNGKDIKVLRTYTSDMAEAIRTNEMSVIKIALAEKEKREQEDLYKKAEGSNASKIFLIIGGIIFIVGAIFGSSYLIQKKKEKDTPLPTISNIETFISYDSKSLIDTTTVTNKDDLINLVKKEIKINDGLIKAIFFIKKTEMSSTLITTNDFLSLIETTAPNTLIRSLSDTYLFGKYSNENAVKENDKSAIFLVLGTKDYNLAYASMLEWEKTMLKDLYVLFDIDVSKSSNQIFEKQWKDIIINNKDARVLYGDNGEGILYYVFVNKNNFVITNNIEGLKEVITRLIIKDAKPL